MADQLTYPGAGMRPGVRTEIQPRRAQSGCGKDTVQLDEVELRSVNGKPSGRKGEQLLEGLAVYDRLSRKTPGRSSLDEVPKPG